MTLAVYIKRSAIVADSSAVCFLYKPTVISTTHLLTLIQRPVWLTTQASASQRHLCCPTRVQAVWPVTPGCPVTEYNTPGTSTINPADTDNQQQQQLAMAHDCNIHRCLSYSLTLMVQCVCYCLYTYLSCKRTNEYEWITCPMFTSMPDWDQGRSL